MKKCLYLLVSALCFLLLFCPSSNAASNTDLENQIKLLSEKGALPSNAYTNYINSGYKTDVSQNNYLLFITGSNNYKFANKFCICRIRTNATEIREYNNKWKVAPTDRF